MVFLKTLTPEGGGSGESEPGVVGIMVDMDERTATFGEEGAAEPTTTVWQLPARVKLSISVPKHDVTVRFMGRTEPVWAGDGASKGDDDDARTTMSMRTTPIKTNSPPKTTKTRARPPSRPTPRTRARAWTLQVYRGARRRQAAKREGSEPAGPPTKKSK